MDSPEINEQNINQPPKYGLKLPLNYKFPKKSSQHINIKAKQLPSLFMLTSRYLPYYANSKLKKKRPIMDYVKMISAQHIYGCPIGGIGGGSIGRGFRGEFCRFQLYPGLYEYIVIPECQFIINIKNGHNETLLQSVLATYPKPKNAPASWQWNLDGADCVYTALYPRGWTTYDLSKYGIKLVCRQISPVIPHNYMDSSLPCAVFVWSATNVSGEQRHVSITFTWKEVVLPKAKQQGKVDLERYSEEHTCGVTLEQKINNLPCSFTIAKNKVINESIHENYALFNAEKQGKCVWDSIEKHGRLMPDDEVGMRNGDKPNGVANGSAGKKHPKKTVKDNAMGLSSSLTIEPGCTSSTEFSLAWDMPKVQFNKTGPVYKRFYTRYFGSDGIAGSSLAAYALDNYERWEKEIEAFQEPILSNDNTPDWLKAALMNELYYIADGGTIWFDVKEEYPANDPRHDFGVFGYLEGHEYRMYNTYDVHFYASFALAKLWPNLQVVIQYMFRDAIFAEDLTRRKELYSGHNIKRKEKHCVPHDLGDPEEEPFTRVNAYNVHDVSEWRDLGPKFVLQVYRDFVLLNRGFVKTPPPNLPYIDAGNEDDLLMRSSDHSETENETEVNESDHQSERNHFNSNNHHANTGVGSILEMLYRKDSKSLEQNGDGAPRTPDTNWSAMEYLKAMYPACEALVNQMLTHDKDCDGIPENSGYPDQTFDAWVMKGPSAYCGGLWLTALLFMSDMARTLNKPADVTRWATITARARDSFNSLWNETYYSHDANTKHTCMAAQLAGHWYLRACGFTYELFPSENVRTALKTIFDYNVMSFRDGAYGAVNGYKIRNGGKSRIDRTALQSEEAWTGVTFGLAATMLHEGMQKEAFTTAGGLVNTMNYQVGLNFETPEALNEEGNHRSIGYMRPLAIWAMQHAIEMNPHMYA